MLLSLKSLIETDSNVFKIRQFHDNQKEEEVIGYTRYVVNYMYRYMPECIKETVDSSNAKVYEIIPIAEMITTSNVEKNNLIVFIISFVYLFCIITSLPNLPIVNLLDKSRNGFLAIIWISQHLYEQKFSTSYIFCMILMTADFTVINVKWT